VTAFDVGTLQAASILSRVGFLIVFLITMLRHPREAYFGLWAGSLACTLVASVMIVGNPAADPLPSAKGAIVFALDGASLVLSWAGLQLFHARPVRLAQAAALSLAPGLLYGLLWRQDAMEWATKAMLACMALNVGLCIAELVRAPAHARLWTQYIVLSGFVGYFSAFLLTIAVVHVSSENLASAESGVYALLVDQCCGVLIQVGYLAMVGERAQTTLGRLAETDALTGVANRYGLLAALRRRSGAAPAGAVVLVDVDRFKAINDTHGHENGDRVLVALAGRLRGVLRPEDVVARWGGEEFLVVLGPADAAAAVAVAERLRAAVAAEPFALDGGVIAVTASIGVSVVAVDETRIDAALARADAALYAAKNGGRNRVVLEPRPAAGGQPADPPPGLCGAVATVHAVAEARSGRA
jgi:diguanylate cyclase (GGDEF)-like protein